MRPSSHAPPRRRPIWWARGMGLRGVYASLYAFWLLSFGALAAGIAWRLEVLSGAVAAVEARASALNRGSKALAAAVRRNKDLERELEILNGLPNLMPQEKGFLRTQKVVSDEVSALRQKVGKRLKGELHIIVDTRANKLYLKKGLVILWQADCSVGMGGTLVDKKTGRRWEFVTPRGEFRVLGKRADPVWRRPDWAFVEAGEPVPPPDDPSREVPGELGAYVLNLGDGYLIHGTKREELLGRAVSHGCVRLGAEPLKKLYESVPVGTKVYII